MAEQRRRVEHRDADTPDGCQTGPVKQIDSCRLCRVRLARHIACLHIDSDIFILASGDFISRKDGLISMAQKRIKPLSGLDSDYAQITSWI